MPPELVPYSNDLNGVVSLAGFAVEIGILTADDNDYVIHAMPVRSKYLNLITPRRGDQR